MTNEEILIQFFIDKFNTGKTNIVTITKQNVADLRLTQEQAARSIYILQEDGLISIKTKSVHDDFSRFWEIALKSSCIHYFEVQKQDKKDTFKDEFRFWIPLIVSIIALFVAA